MAVLHFFLVNSSLYILFSMFTKYFPKIQFKKKSLPSEQIHSLLILFQQFSYAISWRTHVALLAKSREREK